MNLVLFETQEERYHLLRSDPRHRHILKILKAQVGDTLRIGVVQGPVGTGRIEDIDQSGMTISAEWSNLSVGPLPIDVILGHPRPPVLQRMWRDMAAMRIRSIHVFLGDLGEKSYAQSTIWDHLDDRLREGMSQGRHTAQPAVFRYSTLSKVFDELPAIRYRFYGAVDSSQGLRFSEVLGNVAGDADPSVAICIGPERGLSAAEQDILEQHRFRPVNLGTSVLRTETAATGFVVGFTSVLCRLPNVQL